MKTPSEEPVLVEKEGFVATLILNDPPHNPLGLATIDRLEELFTELGLPCIGYFQPMDEPKSQSVMLYVLEHKDRESADAAWKAFMADPRWQAARKATEADGRLTAKPPERVYMKPTDYSPGK